MRVCGTVSQVFNLHRDRIYLHWLASLFGLQDGILRYSSGSLSCKLFFHRSYSQA